MKHFFKIPNRDSVGSVKYRDFYNSLVASKTTGIQKESFLTFLEAIKSLDNIYKFRAFYDLVDSIVNLNLLDKYFTQIQSQFLLLLDVADKQSKNCYALYYLHQIAVNTGLIKEHFPFFLESLEILICPMEYYDVGLHDIAKAVIQTGVIKIYFPKFLEAVDKLSSFRKIRAFHHLIEPAIETGLINKYFLSLLERIDKLPEDFKSDASYHLFNSIDNNLLNKYRTQIENVLVSLLNRIEKVNRMYRFRAFGSLLRSFKYIGIIEDHFSVFLEIVDKISYDQKYLALHKLITSVKKTDLLKIHYDRLKNQYFPFLEDIKKFDNYPKQKAFSALLKLEMGTELFTKHTHIYLDMIKRIPRGDKFLAYISFLKALKIAGLKKENFPAVLEIIILLPDTTSYEAFRLLLNTTKEAGLLEDKFISFLRLINEANDSSKYDMFHELIERVKDTKLLNTYSSLIEKSFLSFLNYIDDLADYERYHSFTRLIEITKEITLTQKNLQKILGIFPKLAEINSLDPCSREETYSNFIKAIANANLENEQAFKIWKDKNQHFKKDECY